MASLLLCLFTGPRSEGVHTVGQLGRAALDAGHQVGVFLGGDGTAHADALQPLRAAGARVVSCTADAALRGLDRPGSPGRGSFVDLGNMAAEADAMLSLGCMASLDGRVVVRHGPGAENGWLALRFATALTLTGRSVRILLDGPGAGWAVPVDARAWMGADANGDVDGAVSDGGAAIFVGGTALASHGIDAAATRDGVQVVDDGWAALSPSSPPARALHVVTGELTDALVVHAIAADAEAGVEVIALGLHDGVYETSVLARTLGEQGRVQVRVGAEDCRRRGVAPPAQRADEYAAIVDTLLASPSALAW